MCRDGFPTHPIGRKLGLRSLDWTEGAPLRRKAVRFFDN